MNNKIDIVVISSHGSGIHAASLFLKQIEPKLSLFTIANKMASKENIARWLNTETQGKVAIFESFAHLANDALRNQILANLEDKCQFVILVRDPLDRLKSVVNTHIYWWACAASGLYAGNVYSTSLFAKMDIEGLLSSVMRAANMKTLVNTFRYLLSYHDKMNVLAISDLSHNKINQTFGRIYKDIFACGMNYVDFPKVPVFNKINNFPDRLRKMGLFDDIEIGICPVAFMDAYNIDKSNIIVDMDPQVCGFEIGNFPGNIAFVLDTGRKYSDETKNYLKSYFASHKHILIAYCKELSKRYKFARQVSDPLLLTDEKLLQYARTNSRLAKQLVSYLAEDLAGIREYDASKIDICKETIAFLPQIKKALGAA